MNTIRRTLLTILLYLAKVLKISVILETTESVTTTRRVWKNDAITAREITDLNEAAFAKLPTYVLVSEEMQSHSSHILQDLLAQVRARHENTELPVVNIRTVHEILAHPLSKLNLNANSPERSGEDDK